MDYYSGYYFLLKKVHIELYILISTLWFQIEDTVLLIGTLLLFDPVLFSLYERCDFGSILNFEALLGAPLVKTT